MTSKFWSGNTRAAKLTAALVEQIRERYKEPGVTQGQLAREYRVTAAQIGRIIRGESWQNIPQPAPTQEDIAGSLQRLLNAQKEVQGTSAREKMAETIKGPADKYLDELKGEASGTDTSSE